MKINDTTRCFPRTRQEAFGPNGDHTIYESAPRSGRAALISAVIILVLSVIIYNLP